MAITLTTLGSSSALPTSTRFTSAHVLNVHERLFLIDCGEGAQIQLRRFKVKMSRINHIFISHLHGDHYYGIFGLISSFHMMNRKSDLHIWSFPGLEESITSTSTIIDEDLSYKIIFHELQQTGLRKLIADDAVEVFSFPLSHRIPTCGFLFREAPKPKNVKREAIRHYNIPVSALPGIKEGKDFIAADGTLVPNASITHSPPKPKSFAYCSDTRYDKKIVKYIKEVDLLYHEATFMDDMKSRAAETFHTTASQAGEIAKAAKVGKLMLGHFSVRYKNTTGLLEEAGSVFENVVVAEDGLVTEI